MKSKNYILKQIHDCLVNRHAYTVEKAEKFIELHRDDKVYELLVLKKELTEGEEIHPDVSYRTSIWRHHDEGD